MTYFLFNVRLLYFFILDDYDVSPLLLLLKVCPGVFPQYIASFGNIRYKKHHLNIKEGEKFLLFHLKQCS